jgi:hypothetical protein
MRCATLSLIVLFVVAANSGCHALHRPASHNEGPYGCGDGCQVEGPYAYSDEYVDCDTEGAYACTDGSCGQGRAHGLIQAIRGAFRRHHGPRAPVGGPPVGTVTYPYYTVRGPRDFLANDPPSIGPY